ncbi:MAG: hypothetical protein B6227_01685 [Fusobacteriia bacterium 4572_74]|nr:MAG: hypothetical protein B6227_01685 [Fusobacteriia bacterium 4572_74]
MFRKNNKLIWILFIFLILPLKTFSFLKINVDPMYVEMDIRKQQAQVKKTNRYYRYRLRYQDMLR